MWFKVDDRFPRHPKTRAAARALGGKHALGRVIGFWTEAGCYCSEFLTDGIITDDQVIDLDADDDPQAVARALVDAGLWKRLSGGYQFHEWEHYNPSAASVKDKRERDRQRKAIGSGRPRQAELPAASGEVVDAVVMDSGWIPDGFRAESAATPRADTHGPPRGLLAESEALARARSRPVPSPERSKAEMQGALPARARPVRVSYRIWSVRSHIHAAVHRLVESGQPYVDGEGRPVRPVLMDAVKEIAAHHLNAEWDYTRELASMVDSALGRRAQGLEADAREESFRRRDAAALRRSRSA